MAKANSIALTGVSEFKKTTTKKKSHFVSLYVRGKYSRTTFQV